MTTVRPETRPVTVPGPAGHPVFGVIPALRRDTPGTLLDGLHRHGDVVGYRFGPARGPRWLRPVAIAVHHPDDVRRLLTDGRLFVRRTVGFTVLTETLGTGLLTSDGDMWLRQRRTLQPLFTPRRVTGYLDLMTAEAERIAAEPAVRSASIVDLHELMQLYTLRVVGRALFGDDVDDAVPRLRRLVPEVGELVVDRTRQLVRTPLSWPGRRNRRLSRARAEQYAIVDAIIAGRAGPAEEHDDLLSRLHAARDPQTGAALSAQEIRDQVLVFLLAGHETTAGALTFTLRLLGQHPELQEEVARAAAEGAGGAGRDGDLVRAAVYEGMRLYPPVYVTERSTAADTEIRGYPVPRGTPVFASPWVTHRHPDFWPEPDRFDPHRFVGAQDRPRYAYFPFGGGPRSCIGEHFAMAEATVLLRTLLRRYRVAALDEELTVQPLITLRPAEPVRAVLHHR